MLGPNFLKFSHITAKIFTNIQDFFPYLTLPSFHCFIDEIVTTHIERCFSQPSHCTLRIYSINVTSGQYGLERGHPGRADRVLDELNLSHHMKTIRGSNG